MENQLTKTENKPRLMQMILGKASKVDLIRSFSSLTLNKIVTENYPSVSSLKRTHGIEQTEKVMQIILHDLSSSFDGKLDQAAIEEITAEISCSILRNLSLEEVYFVCRKIKTAENYGQITINKVLKTFEAHLDERSTAFGQKSLNDHLALQFRGDERRSDQERNANESAFQWYQEWLKEPKNQVNE